jgi:hypothetical protein
LVAAGLIVFVGLPLLINANKKPAWNTTAGKARPKQPGVATPKTKGAK